MPKKAPPVINVLHHVATDEIKGLVCCAGYEQNQWRVKRLAKHLLDWLPDFALTPEEKEAISPINPYRTLEQAARRFFDPGSSAPRGEIGELLTHILCVQEFKTRQFVARLFYKMRTNDQVTGFDIVHLNYEEETKKIELWLGEAKIHANFNSAMNKAISTLNDHIENNFLNETKALIGPKIPKSDPLYSELSWIFDSNISIDEIVNRMVIPVLIASNCTCAGKIGELPDEYEQEYIQRIENIVTSISEKFNKDILVVAIYIPLNDKSSLDYEFTTRLDALT